MPVVNKPRAAPGDLLVLGEGTETYGTAMVDGSGTYDMTGYEVLQDDSLALVLSRNIPIVLIDGRIRFTWASVLDSAARHKISEPSSTSS